VWHFGSHEHRVSPSEPVAGAGMGDSCNTGVATLWSFTAVAWTLKVTKYDTIQSPKLILSSMTFPQLNKKKLIHILPMGAPCMVHTVMSCNLGYIVFFSDPSPFSVLRRRRNFWRFQHLVSRFLQ
jgi:hypothetical protein